MFRNLVQQSLSAVAGYLPPALLYAAAEMCQKRVRRHASTIEARPHRQTATRGKGHQFPTANYVASLPLISQPGLDYVIMGLANRLLITVGPCPRADDKVQAWLGKSAQALRDCPESIVTAACNKVMIASDKSVMLPRVISVL